MSSVPNVEWSHGREGENASRISPQQEREHKRVSKRKISPVVANKA